MSLTKVTRNFQVTLPKDVRKSADIKVGDNIRVKEQDGEITMKKVKKDSFEKAFGIFKGIEIDSAAYVRKIRKGSEKRRERMGL